MLENTPFFAQNGSILREPENVKLAALGRQSRQFSVKRVCLWLDLPPAGYYAWKKSGIRARARRHDDFTGKTKAIYDAHCGRYRGPRIRLALAKSRVFVGRRIERIMRDGLEGRTRRRVVKTTFFELAADYAPNVLKRNFSTTE